MSVRDRDPVLQKDIDITSLVDVHNLDSSRSEELYSCLSGWFIKAWPIEQD